MPRNVYTVITISSWLDDASDLPVFIETSFDTSNVNRGTEALYFCLPFWGTWTRDIVWGGVCRSPKGLTVGLFVRGLKARRIGWRSTGSGSGKSVNFRCTGTEVTGHEYLAVP